MKSCENLWFIITAISLTIAIILFIFVIIIVDICKDLRDTVIERNSYIVELQEQKDRLERDARYCIEKEMVLE